MLVIVKYTNIQRKKYDSMIIVASYFRICFNWCLSINDSMKKEWSRARINKRKKSALEVIKPIIYCEEFFFVWWKKRRQLAISFRFVIVVILLVKKKERWYSRTRFITPKTEHLQLWKRVKKNNSLKSDFDLLNGALKCCAL